MERKIKHVFYLTGRLTLLGSASDEGAQIDNGWSLIASNSFTCTSSNTYANVDQQ